MARTFRLRAADETRNAEISRLIEAARRYEKLAASAPPEPARARPS
jgi:hypothetical protein